MGRGNSSDQERTLAPAIDLKAAASDDGPDGGEVSAKSPCAEERDVSFLITGTPVLTPGDLISIRIGIPPAVLKAGEEVGAVTEPDAALIQGCLEVAYRFEGRITSISLATRVATALVRGAS